MRNIVPPLLGEAVAARPGVIPKSSKKAFINSDAKIIREPNLLVPGKKPIGPVKIDWGHPLTQGLTACIIATQDGMVDLVSATHSNVDTSTFRAGAREYSGGQITELPTSSRYGFTGPNTAFIIYDVDALTNYTPLIACSDTSTTNGWEYRVGNGSTDANGAFIVCNASGYKVMTSNYPISNLAAAGSINNHLFVRRSDNLVTNTPELLFGNITGLVVCGSYSIGGTGSGAITASTDPIRFGSREDGVTKLDGGISFFALWGSKLLSREVARNYNADPYQFLIPA